MQEGGEQLKRLKRIIFFGVVLFVYIFLTSTIYSAKQETKIAEFLITSTLNIANIRNSHVTNVVEREKELTSEVINDDLAKRLKGKILLQVEANGSAWYLNPVDLKRYYLGRPKDTMLIVREFSHIMPVDEIVDYIYFEKKFPEHLAGRFLKNKDNAKEYYYVIPETRLAISLKTPNEAFRLLKDLGLGISNDDIRQIVVGDF